MERERSCDRCFLFALAIDRLMRFLNCKLIVDFYVSDFYMSGERVQWVVAISITMYRMISLNVVSVKGLRFNCLVVIRGVSVALTGFGIY